jgi:type IV pilus assembly protein PilC
MALEIGKNNSAKPKEVGGLNRQIKLSGAKKVTAGDRMFFIEQLAMMLETGSDLYSSLNVLKKQSDNPELQRIIDEISDDINEGKTFSSALARHPDVFSSTYVSLIAASESGGYIREILEHLLSMEKQRDELHSTLVSAASYPAFLIVFSVAMVVFILAVVFPKFADLFSAIEDQLPVTTRFLMALSQIIIDYWWGLLIALATLFAGFMSWLKSDSGARVMDGVKLKTPLIKHVFIKLYLIQTMRVLGLSLSHGVNLIDALDIAKDVVKNRIYHDFLDSLIRDVSEGRNLAGGFNKVDFIPPIVQQMVTTGEETGNLALVSIRIADYFQKELEKLLKFITKIIEPVMLIVMGIIVGVLVSSLILPIFKLSHAVH